MNEFPEAHPASIRAANVSPSYVDNIAFAVGGAPSYEQAWRTDVDIRTE